MFSIPTIIVNLWAFCKTEVSIYKTINTLRSFNDRELEDLGLSRFTLQDAVRNGRKNQEFFR
ncbi:DUF1127 domain-containing protein [Thiothrix lacustris]|uniref:DUF1127 domain-containing protein n=1 Tax=Thiothrix lacustris TaxID=525917 RepID=UPI0027E53F94|nr:DUF1127 domain-containing protein [Thiothrix lacustris]WMP17829.1 DUF1127 domain-containing protein [Thiothrix lacustris]